MRTNHIEVLPGTHLVGVAEGCAVMIACRATDSAGPDTGAVSALHELRTLIARHRPGGARVEPARLAAALGTWHGTHDDLEGFGILIPGESELVILLHGRIGAQTTGPGERMILQAPDTHSLVERVLPLPARSAVLRADNANPDELPQQPGLVALESGVMYGAAAVMWFEEAGTPAPAADEAELAPPMMSARIDAPDDAPPARPALPIVLRSKTAGPALVRPGPPEPKVKGHLCSRKHLNDPRVSFCHVCGIRMDQLTGVLVDGVRPPLGVLVLDDGRSFVLDSDCVIGRDPQGSPGARAGARVIHLDDKYGGLSRAHAEIKLVDWDVTVVDGGSTNGTFVRSAGNGPWTKLRPGVAFTLTPGSEINIGNRVLTFDSSHSRL